MPNKVYMPGEERFGGGATTFCSWDAIERMLRGESVIRRPVIHPGEEVDFRITEHGIDVVFVTPNEKT